MNPLALRPNPTGPAPDQLVDPGAAVIRTVFPLPSVIRVCLTVITLLAIVAAAYFGRPFLLPTCFAIVMALILRPVAAGVERIGIHARVAAALVMATVLAAIVAAIVLAAPAISNFATQAPQIARKFDEKITGVRESVAAIKEASEKVEKLAEPTPAPGDKAPPTPVVVQQPTMFSNLVTTAPGILIDLAYAVVLAFFLLSSRRFLRLSLLRIPPTLPAKFRLARFIRDVGKGVSRYMLATFCISIGVACLAALALTLIGLPNAVVWGAVMGLGSLIPIFGPIAAFIAIGCAALIAFPTVEYALLAPGAVILIHICESQYVTPTVVGRQCEINPLMIFFGVAFMAWLWGTAGAFIAVPSLILLATAARHTPSLHWLEPILTGIDRAAKRP